jgi:hypothetical protein
VTLSKGLINRYFYKKKGEGPEVKPGTGKKIELVLTKLDILQVKIIGCK